MSASLLFGLLIFTAVLLLFVATWRMAPRRDAVDTRLAAYGPAQGPSEAKQLGGSALPARIGDVLSRLTLGQALARSLTQADIPLTAAEYLLIILGVGVAGVVIGGLRGGALLGLATGLALATVPVLYLRIAQSRRYRRFVNQLPDTLTLLVGALRAGYGLNQAVEVLVQQLPQPSAKEFERVSTAIKLGVPVQRALTDMATRMHSDDFDLVVMAVNIQYEMGGNLSQILDTIAETVRERLRIFREIRTLTAQQRLTGYILAALPLFLAVAIFFINPDYFEPVLASASLRIIPAIGIVLMLVGFLVIRRIVSIEV